MNAYTYYPGCSLESTACEYDASVRAVFQALEVELHELEEWNCCGASSAHSVNPLLALALPARNLALAQPIGYDLVMPCAACFNRHKSADHALRHDPERRKELEEIVGFTYQGNVAVRPLLEVLTVGVGFERIGERVTRPLEGLKAVGYYGCLLVRPPDVTQFENPENPSLMNQLLETLGAKAVEWSYATECCGGGLSLTKSSVAARLVNRLAERAREAGAEAIVTSCPLCQINLEMRQSGKQKMPVFYFTELMGLAFGLPEAEAWWSKHLIEPRPLLAEIKSLRRAMVGRG
ncbi:MAG: CoB--CoM heterodisulfide reductase iron-sulfur subunit B family protein [Anaerolineales bacterium]|nr:CoB--CoM heterodisulfide reductase iron-sulfur subunit B family protein [Anaerolineales bacterium]MDW8161907.1 CoB--CoM heterodisulfide reductase iron-sulfur subunit B family protein [Anaerolineales bacterium]